MSSRRQQSAIEEFLSTGEVDERYPAWEGRTFVDSARIGSTQLRQALVARVKELAAKGTRPPTPLPANPSAQTRTKVEPMVRGLFPKAEQSVVLATLQQSVVFVTDDNIETILLDASFHSSAWAIAAVYLGSVGAEPLGPTAPRIVGLSEHTTCYVSPEYCRDGDPFADFVVHECAHIFHNCKRHTLGLKETRRREWLLDIAYLKRETFAYACEAYPSHQESLRSKGRGLFHCGRRQLPSHGPERAGASRLVGQPDDAVAQLPAGHRRRRQPTFSISLRQTG